MFNKIFLVNYINGYYEIRNDSTNENIYITRRDTYQDANKVIKFITRNCTCKSKDELCKWCNGNQKVYI
jgi:hypothetical protein